MSVCFKHGVTVFPVFKLGKWYIATKQKNKEPKTYKKQLQQEEVNEAVAKTYLYLASKL